MQSRQARDAKRAWSGATNIHEGECCKGRRTLGGDSSPDPGPALSPLIRPFEHVPAARVVALAPFLPPSLAPAQATVSAPSRADGRQRE